MPRIVVPIASPLAHCLSNIRSSSACQGKITWARSLRIRFVSTLTPRLDESVDLGQQGGRVQHHAAGDHALDLGPEDAAGHQRELERLARRGPRCARRWRRPGSGPRYRAVRSSRSTILPLASSPHCKPITQVAGTARPSTLRFPPISKRASVSAPSGRRSSRPHLPRPAASCVPPNASWMRQLHPTAARSRYTGLWPFRPPPPSSWPRVSPTTADAQTRRLAGPRHIPRR